MTKQLTNPRRHARIVVHLFGHLVGADLIAAHTLVGGIKQVVNESRADPPLPTSDSEKSSTTMKWRHAKNNHEYNNLLRRVASHGWFPVFNSRD